MGDVDKALRRVSRKFPEELAKALYGSKDKIIIGEWLETQIVGPDRRLDRTLRLSVGGEPRLLHVEFQSKLEDDVPYRVFEYHTLLAIGGFDPKKPTEPLNIDSVVVVLGGPQKKLPKEGAFQTSCRGQPFCGVHYRIEAVYQQTVNELLKSDSVLWLIFAPLALDADEDKMKRALQEAKKKTNNQYLYEEVAVAMSVIADADPKQRGLGKLITSLIPMEVLMQSWIYTEGEKAGKIAGKVEDILKIVKVRKLKISKVQQAQIEGCTDLVILDQWHTKALTASSVTDVLAPAAKPTKTTKPGKKH